MQKNRIKELENVQANSALCQLENKRREMYYLDRLAVKLYKKNEKEEKKKKGIERKMQNALLRKSQSKL